MASSLCKKGADLSVLLLNRPLYCNVTKVFLYLLFIWKVKKQLEKNKTCKDLKLEIILSNSSQWTQLPWSQMGWSCVLILCRGPHPHKPMLAAWKITSQTL